MNNFFSAEQAIIDRLKVNMTDVSILSTALLTGVKEQAQVTPAIHLVYGGHKPIDHARRSIDVIYEQIWITVIAVRSVAAIKSGQSARQQAGVIMHRLLALLQGWQPTSEHSSLKPTPSSREGYSGGFIYYPLGFMTRVKIQAIQA